jgi:HptB-dependent secretion and biofilm anti anti-sigma factor
MAIAKNVSPDNRVITIRVKGRFDINVFDEFNSAYKDVSPPGEKYVVDLAETEFLDSAALGMLLLMRERLERFNAKAAIMNCPPKIKRTLVTVALHKLINIE